MLQFYSTSIWIGIKGSSNGLRLNETLPKNTFSLPLNLTDRLHDASKNLSLLYCNFIEKENKLFLDVRSITKYSSKERAEKFSNQFLLYFLQHPFEDDKDIESASSLCFYIIVFSFFAGLASCYCTMK
jgi:hypothetical protein